MWNLADSLKAFQFSNGLFGTTPSTQSAVTVTGGAAGGALSLSSNQYAPGTNILWASVPLQDPDHNLSGGQLFAFDAANIGNELWDSRQNTARDDLGTGRSLFPLLSQMERCTWLPIPANLLCTALSIREKTPRSSMTPSSEVLATSSTMWAPDSTARTAGRISTIRATAGITPPAIISPLRLPARRFSSAVFRTLCTELARFHSMAAPKPTSISMLLFVPATSCSGQVRRFRLETTSSSWV